MTKNEAIDGRKTYYSSLSITFKIDQSSSLIFVTKLLTNANRQELPTKLILTKLIDRIVRYRFSTTVLVLRTNYRSKLGIIALIETIL